MDPQALPALTLTNEVVSALIVGVGSVIAALIAVLGAIILARMAKADRHLRRVETKIEGIRNGTPTEVKAAIAQLMREKAERDIYGLPLRRIGDKPPIPGVVPSDIPTHGAHEEPGHTHSGLPWVEPGHRHPDHK